VYAAALLHDVGRFVLASTKATGSAPSRAQPPHHPLLEHPEQLRLQSITTSGDSRRDDAL